MGGTWEHFGAKRQENVWAGQAGICRNDEHGNVNSLIAMSLLATFSDLLSSYITPSLSPFAAVSPHVDWRDGFLLLLSPLFFAMAVAEWLRMRGEKRQGKLVHDWRDSADSLVLGGVYTWVDVVLVLALVLPAMNWLYTHHRLASIELTPWSFAVSQGGTTPRPQCRGSRASGPFASRVAS